MATGQEMLVFQDAMLLPRVYSGPSDKFLVWGEPERPIRVTALPTLGEIDAAEKWTQGEVQ